MTSEELLKVAAAVVAIITPVAGVAGVIGWLMKKWAKSVRKSADAQIEAERQRSQALVKQAEAESSKLVAVVETQSAKAKFELQNEILGLQQHCQEVEAERDRFAHEAQGFQKRLTDLESFNGALWERDISSPPPFRDRTQRKTVFISVMNLKGGVGKTTLTANLGVGLARKGHRVLLVDLDFQGSLTRLCIDSDEFKESVAKGRLTDRLLDVDAEARPPSVRELAQRVRSVVLESGKCDVIAASERLAEAELRAQGRWLATSNPDARFLFRRHFHAPEVCEDYEYVFFDCPPRMTTAAVNALACCDFLLVPVLLEQGSVEALPRTLAFLTRLQHVTRARLLGVVANRVGYWGEQIIAAQRTIFNYLPETIKVSGYGKKELFRAVVRQDRRMIEDAANRGRIASAEDNGLALFADVVAEVEKGTRA